MHNEPGWKVDPIERENLIQQSGRCHAEHMTHEEIREELKPVRLAALGLAFSPGKGASDTKPALFTGFGVKCQGYVFWVTAAHVFGKIDEAFEAFPKGELFLKGLSSPKTAICFRKVPDTWVDIGQTLKRLHAEGGLALSGDQLDLAIFDEMDIGVLYLPAYYVKQLEIDGFEPLPIDALSIPAPDEVSRIKDGELDMRFFLHGALAESLTVTSQSGSFDYVWSTLPIDAENWGTPCFTFKPLWTREQLDGGVKGMSGGPIVMLGFQQLHVVAVQSSQLLIGQRIPKELRAWDSQFVRQIIEQLSQLNWEI